MKTHFWQAVSDANFLSLWQSTSSREIEEKDTGEENRQRKAGRAAGEVIEVKMSKLKVILEVQAPLNNATLSCVLAVFALAVKPAF